MFPVKCMPWNVITFITPKNLQFKIKLQCFFYLFSMIFNKNKFKVLQLKSGNQAVHYLPITIACVCLFIQRKRKITLIRRGKSGVGKDLKGICKMQREIKTHKHTYIKSWSIPVVNFLYSIHIIYMYEKTFLNQLFISTSTLIHACLYRYRDKNTCTHIESWFLNCQFP